MPARQCLRPLRSGLSHPRSGLSSSAPTLAHSCPLPLIDHARLDSSPWARVRPCLRPSFVRGSHSHSLLPIRVRCTHRPCLCVGLLSVMLMVSVPTCPRINPRPCSSVPVTSAGHGLVQTHCSSSPTPAPTPTITCFAIPPPCTRGRRAFLRVRMPACHSLYLRSTSAVISSSVCCPTCLPHSPAPLSTCLLEPVLKPAGARVPEPCSREKIVSSML